MATQLFFAMLHGEVIGTLSMGLNQSWRQTSSDIIKIWSFQGQCYVPKNIKGCYRFSGWREGAHQREMWGARLSLLLNYYANENIWGLVIMGYSHVRNAHTYTSAVLIVYRTATTCIQYKEERSSEMLNIVHQD